MILPLILFPILSAWMPRPVPPKPDLTVCLITKRGVDRNPSYKDLSCKSYYRLIFKTMQVTRKDRERPRDLLLCWLADPCATKQ